MISGFGTTVYPFQKRKKKRKMKTKKKKREVNDRKLVVHLKQPKNSQPLNSSSGKGLNVFFIP